MLTQIYEVSTPEQATALSAIGISHIGLLVGDGEFPRELAVTEAVRIAGHIIPPSKFVALFLTADLGRVETALRHLAPAIIHLGAAAELLGPADAAKLKNRSPNRVIMRSVPVFGEPSLNIARSYDGIADFLLLDSYHLQDRQIGALGVTHDWNISRRIVRSVRTPVILAGGLGPDNVADAISAVRPAGVDSKTKTDTPGSHDKDIDQVRRFHAAAMAAR
ncbi:phosphoribosylanthranilate isomerase [Rhodopila sp.]|uniref:phosphoribosylanthranilate isomerase n=1 Tax=Rhodopila sp. TaxID=2480087 RepID=UPI003D1442B2